MTQAAADCRLAECQKPGLMAQLINVLCRENEPTVIAVLWFFPGFYRGRCVVDSLGDLGLPTSDHPGSMRPLAGANLLPIALVGS